MGKKIKLVDILESLSQSENHVTATHAKTILDTGNVELAKHMGSFLQAVCTGDLHKAVDLADEDNKKALRLAFKKAITIPDSEV